MNRFDDSSERVEGYILRFVGCVFRACLDLLWYLGEVVLALEVCLLDIVTLGWICDAALEFL